jgi:integrase
VVPLKDLLATASFVSLLSANGLDIEKISLLVGHKSSQMTETVYRHQSRPVPTDGAEAMDGLLPQHP